MGRNCAEGETPQETLARLDSAAPAMAVVAAPTERQREGRWTLDPTRDITRAFWFFVVGMVAIYGLLPRYYYPGTTQTATTTGVVRDLNSTDDGMCFPHVDFIAKGTTFTAVPTWSSDFCPWTVGGPGTVRYDPANPSDADVEEPGIVALLLNLVVPLGLMLAAFVALTLAVASWCTPSWQRTRRTSVASIRRALDR